MSKLQSIYSSSSVLQKSSLEDGLTGTVHFFDLLQTSRAATAPASVAVPVISTVQYLNLYRQAITKVENNSVADDAAQSKGF